MELFMPIFCMCAYVCAHAQVYDCIYVFMSVHVCVRMYRPVFVYLECAGEWVSQCPHLCACGVGTLVGILLQYVLNCAHLCVCMVVCVCVRIWCFQAWLWVFVLMWCVQVKGYAHTPNCVHVHAPACVQACGCAYVPFVSTFAEVCVCVQGGPMRWIVIMYVCVHAQGFVPLCAFVPVFVHCACVCTWTCVCMCYKFSSPTRYLWRLGLLHVKNLRFACPKFRILRGEPELSSTGTRNAP